VRQAPAGVRVHVCECACNWKWGGPCGPCWCGNDPAQPQWFPPAAATPAPAPRVAYWRYAAALVAIIGCALAAGAFGFMATRSWAPHPPVTRPSLCVTPTTVDGLARCR